VGQFKPLDVVLFPDLVVTKIRLDGHVLSPSGNCGKRLNGPYAGDVIKDQGQKGNATVNDRSSV
jgi:hypothetical protein